MMYDKTMNELDKNMFLKYKKIYNEIIQNGKSMELRNYPYLMAKTMSKISNIKLKEQKLEIELYDFFERETNDKMLSMTIDKYFGDITSNVLTNIKTIVNFNNSLDNKIIDSQNLKIYKKLIDYDSLNINQKVELYNKMNTNINYAEQLYDDFRNSQNYSYNLINVKSIKPTNLKNKQSMFFFEKFGIKVYELMGENFISIIHCTGLPKNNINDYTSLWHEKGRKTGSFSIIGDNNLGTFADPKTNFILGFEKLDVDRIMHMYHSDSFTANELGSDRVNEIYSPQNLNANTKGYNEILYKENSDLKPSYLVCYDEITNQDIEASQKFALPIVLIYTKAIKPINLQQI